MVMREWGMYAMSYKAAADLLVEQSMENGVDALVHSAMFLHRHYLEIGIKDLIVPLLGYYEEPYSPPKVHDLTHLWREARALMEREWNAHQHLSDYDAIQARVSEFHQIDRDSTAFRYPVSRDGEPSLQGLADHQQAATPKINLIQVKWVVGGIAAFLEGTIDMAYEAGQTRYLGQPDITPRTQGTNPSWHASQSCRRYWVAPSPR